MHDYFHISFQLQIVIKFYLPVIFISKIFIREFNSPCSPLWQRKIRPVEDRFDCKIFFQFTENFACEVILLIFCLTNWCLNVMCIRVGRPCMCLKTVNKLWTTFCLIKEQTSKFLKQKSTSFYQLELWSNVLVMNSTLLLVTISILRGKTGL